MDLISWYRDTGAAISTRSDARAKSAKLRSAELELPEYLETTSIRGASISRSPGGGAISIEAILLTARREDYRALGLVFIAYAMSSQAREFRLRMPNQPDEIDELVIWPSECSQLEAELGYRSRAIEVHCKPSLPEGNPNYTTTEQDRSEQQYPREHLPYCRSGALDVEGGGIVRRGEPIAVHFKGTAPSLIWMGKYLFNLALEDSKATLAYLYNTCPAESLRWMSAELRFTIADPADGPQLFGQP